MNSGAIKSVACAKRGSMAKDLALRTCERKAELAKLSNSVCKLNALPLAMT